MMNGEDIVWVRSLSGYRLGVLLPKGFAFISSNVAAQLATTADGRLKLAFANPSGQSNPVTIHARKTPRRSSRAATTDMFFDDIRTLYDLDTPETGRISVEQTYSDYRKGDTAKLDTLSYLPMTDVKAVDLDTAKAFVTSEQGNATVVKLDVPIVDDKQSAHIRLTGTVADGSYKVVNGDLVFERTLRGLRNTDIVAVGLARDRGVAVGHHWNLPEPRVRVAHQPERGKQLQGGDSRAAIRLRSRIRASFSVTSRRFYDLWARGKTAFGIYAPNENPGPRGQGPAGPFTRRPAAKSSRRTSLRLRVPESRRRRTTPTPSKRSPTGCAAGRDRPEDPHRADPTNRRRRRGRHEGARQGSFDLGADGVTIRISPESRRHQAIGFFERPRRTCGPPRIRAATRSRC